jgi:hypothetical protein
MSPNWADVDLASCTFPSRDRRHAAVRVYLRSGLREALSADREVSVRLRASDSAFKRSYVVHECGRGLFSLCLCNPEVFPAPLHVHVLEDEPAVLAVPDHTKWTLRLDLDVPRSERRIVIVRGSFVETGVAETFSNLLEIDGSQYSESVDAEALTSRPPPPKGLRTRSLDRRRRGLFGRYGQLAERTRSICTFVGANTCLSIPYISNVRGISFHRTPGVHDATVTSISIPIIWRGASLTG